MSLPHVSVSGDTGKSFAGDVTKPAGYFCYGKEILAPADGEVVETGLGYPDSFIAGNGQADCSARDIRGNHILICHAEEEYFIVK